MKLTSKPLYVHIENNIDSLRHVFRETINDKNEQLFKIKNNDFRDEYEIADSSIEKLINE